MARLRALFVLMIALTSGCRTHGPSTASTKSEAGGFLGDPLPGAPVIPGDLLGRLKAAWRARDAGYRPRTRHLRPDGTPKYTNRLFLSSSPYLLQHAHNPTNWYPWGDEAFQAARRLGRPILLSIGYSTCHWCHVMEEESFEDEEVARYINAHYIPIKVDREERPDIDAVYMSAVQMLTGGGGWPMTVWLTPERRPYYGGTYFPARDGARGARVGLLTLLRQLRARYDQQPTEVAAAAAQITEGIARSLSPGRGGAGLPDASSMRALADFYRQRFDPVNGGAAGAPKFPSNLSVRFLLRFYRRTGDRDALAMATLTLEKMARGGIYDHVGGGFHRYSTDDHWLVPHFEKMLDDNAVVAVAYLEGYQATGRADFAAVARETLRYLVRDMGAPDGGFYSATDADSPGPAGHREEGRFFTWTFAEIEQALVPAKARLAATAYGVTTRGNFEGRNILSVPRPLEEVARELNIAPPALRAELDGIDDDLYRARARRPPPLRDEKIIAAWNGLAISALARAALVFPDGAYARQATRAADFVLAKMRAGQAGGERRLLRAYEGGRAQLDATSEDYAFMIAGLLDLFEATGEPRWLGEARSLDDLLERHYQDKTGGGYFLTADDGEPLLAREKRGEDGAEPSGNSVEALNLLRLYGLTFDERYRRRAEATLRAFSETLRQAPAALAEMMLAVDDLLDDPKEIVLVTPTSRAEAEPFLARLRATFTPNRVLAVVAGPHQAAALGQQVPLVEDKVALGGRPTAYVCRRGACELPTTDPSVFEQQIRKVRKLEP